MNCPVCDKEMQPFNAIIDNVPGLYSCKTQDCVMSGVWIPATIYDYIRTLLDQNRQLLAQFDEKCRDLQVAEKKFELCYTHLITEHGCDDNCTFGAFEDEYRQEAIKQIEYELIAKAQDNLAEGATNDTD